jgi:hypothetical protein
VVTDRHELAQLAAELEAAVARLGAQTRERWPDWYRERLAEFHADPGPALTAQAELWFLLEEPLDDGHSPLEQVRLAATSRPLELLARSELRAWRIESPTAECAVAAACPLGYGRARLELCHAPTDDAAAAPLLPGTILVGRSVPLGPERWLLLGLPRVIACEAAPAFGGLLASLSAPRGEFWRVHGGVLTRIAATWPQEYAERRAA